jgi:Zn-dependent protease
MNVAPIFAAATWIIPLVVAITFHEVAHGVVANAFGDPTARDAGRLTFNPLRHVDPVGTVILPLMLAVTGAPIFGWARPVPVRMGQLRNPRWQGLLVSAAGPAMNFLLAIVGAASLSVILRMTEADHRGTAILFLLVNLNNFMMVNLFLAIFNLLPIPPLDGGAVLAKLLPTPIGRRFALMGRYGFGILIFLLVALPMAMPQFDLIGQLVQPPVRFMARTLFTLFMGH